MRRDDTPEDLSAVEITTLGCEVVRLTENRMLVFEPVSWKAPSMARPFLDGVDEVVFYFWPLEVRRDGVPFREWDRCRTLLPWGAEFLHAGTRWGTSVSFVMRRRGGWWMRHTAWRKQPFVIPALEKCAERRGEGPQMTGRAGMDEGGMQSERCKMKHAK
jgi:hypothetical protein